MHLPSHIANLNVLGGTPASSPFRTLYPSAHPTTLAPSADDDHQVVSGGQVDDGPAAAAQAGMNGMEDPALEESLKRHLDLWINTEFSWIEDQAGFGGETTTAAETADSSPRDKVEGVVDQQGQQQQQQQQQPGHGKNGQGKEDEGEIEMGLMDYYQTHVKQAKDKNVLLDQRLGADDDLKESQQQRASDVVVVSDPAAGAVDGQAQIGKQAPDLASFLDQYSALLSSSIPSLDSLTPPSGNAGRANAGRGQAGQKQDVADVEIRGEKAKEGNAKNHSQKPSSHSEQSTPHSQPTPRGAQQQQQQHHHHQPPAPPINTPVISRAVLNDSVSNEKLPGQEQNLMALLAAAFPQYASTFESAPQQQQQQQQQHAGMNAFLVSGNGTHGNGHGNHNANSARAPHQESTPAPQSGANTPFVYAPHHPAFSNHVMDFNGQPQLQQQQQQQQQQHSLSGEIDRVFGTVDLGDGLYHHHQHHHTQQQEGRHGIDADAQRSGSASAGSLSDTSVKSFELGQQQQEIKKRKLSDDSTVAPVGGGGKTATSMATFEPRYTQASLASLMSAQAIGQGHHSYAPSSYAQQQQQSRKRSLDSVDPEQHDNGVLPDGVTPEEDKRRRNTAASARFRMKKKEREQALERHAKELEDRLSRMERDMDGLRKENGWLKALLINGAPQPFSSPSASSEEGKLEVTSAVAQSVE